MKHTITVQVNGIDHEAEIIERPIALATIPRGPRKARPKALVGYCLPGAVAA